MTDADNLVEQHFPYDGPHSAATVREAAAAVAELVRYLNNATGPGNARTTVEWAATIDRILGQINRTMYSLEQLLGQLADGMRAQADDPTVYDDRHDRPGKDTARLAANEITATIPHVLRLARQLANARALTDHLGND